MKRRSCRRNFRTELGLLFLMLIMVGIGVNFKGPYIHIVRADESVENIETKESDIRDVSEFGAYGDGIHDDTLAIKAAFSCGKSVSFNKNAFYKCTSAVFVNSSNVTIYGNDATIFTDNDYNRDFEWFFNISNTSNVTIDNLNIVARETIETGYKSQIGIRRASQVTIRNCDFLIPDTVSTGDDGWEAWVNIDCYGTWSDVDISNCNIINQSDAEGGLCIQIRDLYGTACSNLNIYDNYCYSNAHDEIIAIFSYPQETSEVNNVKIYNNEIVNAPTINARPHTMCITLGYVDSNKVDNIEIYNNKFTNYSDCYFATMGNVSNLNFHDNDIVYYNIGDGSWSFLFSVVNNYDISNKNNVFQDNKIQLSAPAGIRCLYYGAARYRNNQVVTESKINSIKGLGAIVE